MASGRIPSVEGGIQPTIVDAKGDLIVATAADTVSRLAVGTNNHVLTADSSTSTGLKWAAPVQALTLISRQSVSGQSVLSFEGVFTSTYSAYLIVVEKMWGTSTGADLLFRLLYSTNTEQATSYYGAMTYWSHAGTETIAGVSNGTSAKIVPGLYNQASSISAANIWVSTAGNATEETKIWGTGYGHNALAPVIFGASSGNQTYTGFNLKPSAGNFTGTVACYGLAEA